MSLNLNTDTEKKLVTVYLKFKVNWASCILPDNPRENSLSLRRFKQSWLHILKEKKYSEYDLSWSTSAKYYAAFHTSETVCELMESKTWWHFTCQGDMWTPLGSVRIPAVKASHCVLHVRFHNKNPNVAGPPRDFRL